MWFQDRWPMFHRWDDECLYPEVGLQQQRSRQVSMHAYNNNMHAQTVYWHCLRQYNIPTHIHTLTAWSGCKKYPNVYIQTPMVCNDLAGLSTRGRMFHWRIRSKIMPLSLFVDVVYWPDHGCIVTSLLTTYDTNRRPLCHPQTLSQWEELGTLIGKGTSHIVLSHTLHGASLFFWMFTIQTGRSVHLSTMLITHQILSTQSVRGVVQNVIKWCISQTWLNVTTRSFSLRAPHSRGWKSKVVCLKYRSPTHNTILFLT